jgi:hypothetical protein
MELMAALEGGSDFAPVLALFEAGLLYPDLSASRGRLKSFEQWLGLGGTGGPAVFAHPLVTARALGADLGLPPCPGATSAKGAVHEADGLEWPLRLAAVWQQVAAAPLRRTQQGDFFKRDLDRLRGDAVLNSPPADQLAELPDAGLLTVELALLQGMLHEELGELTAAPQPSAWEDGLPAVLEAIFASLPRLESWNAHAGWTGRPTNGNPCPSAYFLALLLLSQLPDEAWADPAAVEQWVITHHPYWGGATNGKPAAAASVSTFLLGFAYQLRLLQAATGDKGNWLVRLSPLGRWLLGLADAPVAAAVYPQTLLVQPNLEIVAYRQGLTPGLIRQLSQFAAWKSLGSACLLQLQPETVYRALESGQTFDTICRTLEQHGMRPTPPAVIESLRTWSDKRERIVVYPSATLFEFASADELNEALARGLPGTRLSDRLAVVVEEEAVDFRHFRLAGTRDYGLPPEKCIDVADDGVTLHVDIAKSDLMLESELRRFAEPLPPDRGVARPVPSAAAANGRRTYRMTPTSLAGVREGGYPLPALEEWFLLRSGQPLSPAARLLLSGPRKSAPELRRLLVLAVPDAETADGLLQWPETRSLIDSRLGPSALAVAEEHVEELRTRLAALGINVAL